MLSEGVPQLTEQPFGVGMPESRLFTTLLHSDRQSGSYRQIPEQPEGSVKQVREACTLMQVV